MTLDTEERGLGQAEAIAEELRKQALTDAQKEVEALTQEGIGSMALEQKLGVLQRLITAVASEKEILQTLLTGAFDNKNEALLCADAIAERERYGVTIRPIVLRVTAQCSVNSGRVDRVLRAVNNQITNARKGSGMPDWKRRQDDKTLG